MQPPAPEGEGLPDEEVAEFLYKRLFLARIGGNEGMPANLGIFGGIFCGPDVANRWRSFAKDLTFFAFRR